MIRPRKLQLSQRTLVAFSPTQRPIGTQHRDATGTPLIAKRFRRGIAGVLCPRRTIVERTAIRSAPRTPASAMPDPAPKTGDVPSATELKIELRQPRAWTSWAQVRRPLRIREAPSAHINVVGASRASRCNSASPWAKFRGLHMVGVPMKRGVAPCDVGLIRTRATTSTRSREPLILEALFEQFVVQRCQTYCGLWRAPAWLRMSERRAHDSRQACKKLLHRPG